jgi:hypothetical protein
MNIDCFACNDKVNVPYFVFAANPYRENFLCDPCEVDLEMRSYGLVK